MICILDTTNTFFAKPFNFDEKSLGFYMWLYLKIINCSEFNLRPPKLNEAEGNLLGFIGDQHFVENVLSLTGFQINCVTTLDTRFSQKCTFSYCFQDKVERFLAKTAIHVEDIHFNPIYQYKTIN